jgi:hypothetical protein
MDGAPLALPDGGRIGAPPAPLPPAPCLTSEKVVTTAEEENGEQWMEVAITVEWVMSETIRGNMANFLFAFILFGSLERKE